jgi:hypothetical protein
VTIAPEKLHIPCPHTEVFAVNEADIVLHHLSGSTGSASIQASLLDLFEKEEHI